MLDRSRLLGLERLEGAQRARELGLRGAAVAEHGLDRAGAVAVADQRESDPDLRDVAPLEHLDLDPLGALESPSGARDPPHEHALQDAHGRELGDQRRLERRERGAVLDRQHHVLCCAQAVLQGILR